MNKLANGTNIAAARIADPTFFAEHRMPAHSDHRWFASLDEARTGGSSFETLLNGLWKFAYAKNPESVIEGFQAVDYDASGWDDIPVPAHIQLEGYDRPQYVNLQFPWDGHENLELGGVPCRFNPVGCYITSFTLDEPLADGERLSISFHGAESAIALWLNGEYIGYATDSFTPSEFDLTEHLVDGENRLAAQVFKWTTHSWLEDQDFYRFSGIFRDVVLYRRPATHLQDVDVRTELSDDLSEAVITLAYELDGDGSVSALLRGVGQLTPGPDGKLSITLDQPRLWSGEDPHLYDLTIEVRDGAGALTEVVPQRVGVRRFGIEDGVLKINGKRLVFKGVNRHEFGLNGRVMDRATTEADLRIIKGAGINAVRTSHYPNNSFFYDLCDEFGVYVIDEMNLETHALWDRIRQQGRPIDEAIPGDHPQWRDAVLDRAASMYERDKNHASIVMWSCGNESYGGTNLLDVSNYFRDRDDRPVHYEGVDWDPRYPETTDVYSKMYTPVTEIEAFLKENRAKPFILCEFAHAMGNSFGAVDKYMDLADRDPLFQGGFIWDFADQAIVLKDRHGKQFFGYGGDCGEAPHDGDFCGNGILFADHSPTPRMQEVAYLFQGLSTDITADSVRVTNRMLFTSTAVLDCVVTLARESVVLATASIDTDVAPGESESYPLPFALPEQAGEYTLDVSYRLRAANRWGVAGQEVGWEQAVLEVPGTVAPRRGPAPELIEGIHNFGVRGQHFSALFSRNTGGLQSYTYGTSAGLSRELLKAVPMPNFWHAPTANERGWRSAYEDGDWLLASRYAVLAPGENPSVASHDDSVEVTYRYVLPTRPESRCDVSYRVFGDGTVAVTIRLLPGAGLGDLPEFGMLMTIDADYGHLRWYGDGPDECYVDRRGGARLGVYDAEVADLLTPYLKPQEAGSRTGVRWAEVTDASGIGLRFSSATGMEFSALSWSPFEIENAAHAVDLPPIQNTYLRPAMARRGVGGDDSWGSKTHEEFRVPAKGELVFEFSFGGVTR